MKTRIIYIIFIFIIAGCDIEPTSEPVMQRDLYGIYYANYNTDSHEYIELRHDSIYIHYYKSPDGNKFCDTGVWRLVYELDRINRPLILFNGFINRYPLDGHAYSTWRYAVLDTMPKDWMPYAYKKKDLIMIKRYPNFNQYYIKEPNLTISR